MRAFRRLALVALVLVSAIVVVASPAFATPRLTTSTGTSGRPDGNAVSPFITPIGDTLTSSITISTTFRVGAGTSLRYTGIDGARPTITCIRLTASGHILLTHTRIQVSSLNFDGCRIDRDNTTVVQVSVTGISSSNPAFIHLRSADTPARGSHLGVFEIGPRAGILLHVKSLVLGGLTLCTVRFDQQSIRLRLTTANKLIEVDDPTVRYSLELSLTSSCPNPAVAATFTAGTSISYASDTPADRHTVTVFSTP